MAEYKVTYKRKRIGGTGAWSKENVKVNAESSSEAVNKAKERVNSNGHQFELEKVEKL